MELSNNTVRPEAINYRFQINNIHCYQHFSIVITLICIIFMWIKQSPLLLSSFYNLILNLPTMKAVILIIEQKKHDTNADLIG
jgi:hypothetical protein